MKFKIKKYGRYWCLMLSFSPKSNIALFKHEQHDEVLGYLAYLDTNEYIPLSSSLHSKNRSLRKS